MRMFVPLIPFFAAACLGAPALAQACNTPSGHPVPRFVSLKSSEANGRAGPSLAHPVRWAYRRAGLPVQVVAESGAWRRIRDPGGEEVWMHGPLLSGRRSVWTLEAVWLHARPDAQSPQIALAEPGAVLWLERCRSGWCRLEASGYRGWARADAFWGVYADEAAYAGALEGGVDPCYRSLPASADAPAAREANGAAR